MSHVPRPGRFPSSRPDSPRPTTDSLPPLYPPSATYRRTERTTAPIHKKPARNSPRDLTGQITCERSPKVTGGGYGDVCGGIWQNGTETSKVRNGVHCNTLLLRCLITPSWQVAIKVLRLNHDRDEETTHKLHKVNGLLYV